MPYAFGHLIFSWFFGKVVELKRKTKLNRWAWFFLLFGAIFPDGDFLIDWALKTHIHRTFSHSLLMVLLGFLFIYVIVLILKKRLNLTEISPKALGFAFGFGILTHLIADMVFGWPGVALFWPLKIRFWAFGFGASNYFSLHFSEISKERLIFLLRGAIFDMTLGVIWLSYLFFRKKIKEF